MTAIRVGPESGPATPVVDAAHAVRAVRHRLRRREITVSIVLAAVVLAIFMASLVVGDFPLTVAEVFESLTGRGTRSTDFIVYELRLPRVLTGIAVGVCFGISGAIFQSMVRNPLASPDIIGISAGASASAVIAILALGLGGFAVSAFAFVGALVTAIAIYLLAWRQGVSGYRLVLVGIGIGAMMYALIDYLMTRASIWDAQVALRWLTGSLNGATATEMQPLLIIMAVALPLTLWASRSLSGLQLGDDTAKGIGIRVERSRLALIVFGVALNAIATAAAGPVGFVAFVAGPIARRLTHGTGIALIPAALVGAAVVIAADFVGQHLLPVPMPVGILTAAVGAPYLLYLLVVSNRIGQEADMVLQDAPVTRHTLEAAQLSLGYGERRIVTDLSVTVPTGQVSVIIGANGCGKSTLLRGLCRLLTPVTGSVLLDGKAISTIPSKEVAKVMGLLPQAPVAPEGITVADLVSRGRYPHQGWFRRWSSADDEAVAEALRATGTAELADRPIDEMSGGQRQRVWIAMALAQETDLLLLDEPTTYLDLTHQVEVLDLLTDLNRRRGTTIVIVMHDLNLACRYADHLIAMRDGQITQQGRPADVITTATMREVFGLSATIVPDPVSGTPTIIPIGRHHCAPALLTSE